MAKKSENESAFKKFLSENKSLTFMLPLLAILIIVVIIVYSGMGKEKNVVSEKTPNTNNPIDTNQPQVEVLPQIIRSENGERVDVKNDPFEEPMVLTGVIYSESRSTAIIKWGGYSYIVKKDDYVGESQWKVRTIEKDKITLESENDSKVITLDG